MKPGFSGWAQINGRNAISWEEKFRLDVWYVDHQGLWLDLRSCLLTYLESDSTRGHQLLLVRQQCLYFGEDFRRKILWWHPDYSRLGAKEKIKIWKDSLFNLAINGV